MKTSQFGVFLFCVLLFVVGCGGEAPVSEPTVEPTNEPTETAVSSTNTPNPTPTDIPPTATPVPATATPSPTETPLPPSPTPIPEVKIVAIQAGSEQTQYKNIDQGFAMTMPDAWHSVDLAKSDFGLTDLFSNVGIDKTLLPTEERLAGLIESGVKFYGLYTDIDVMSGRAITPSVNVIASPRPDQDDAVIFERFASSIDQVAVAEVTSEELVINDQAAIKLTFSTNQLFVMQYVILTDDQQFLISFGDDAQFEEELEPLFENIAETFILLDENGDAEVLLIESTDEQGPRIFENLEENEDIWDMGLDQTANLSRFASIKNDKLRLNVQATGNFSGEIMTNTGLFDAFSLSAEFEIVEIDGDVSFGLEFNESEDGLYAFVIETSPPYFVVIKYNYITDEWEEDLISWTQSAVINADQANELRVESDGEIFSFYINDIKVADAKDENRLPAGNHGVYYGLGTDESILLDVDNYTFIGGLTEEDNADGESVVIEETADNASPTPVPSAEASDTLIIGIDGWNEARCSVGTPSQTVTQADLFVDSWIYMAYRFDEADVGKQINYTWYTPSGDIHSDESYTLEESCLTRGIYFDIDGSLGVYKVELKLNGEIIETGQIEQVASGQLPDPSFTGTLGDFTYGFGWNTPCTVPDPVSNWSAATLNDEPFALLATPYGKEDIGNEIYWELLDPSGNVLDSGTRTLKNQDWLCHWSRIYMYENYVAGTYVVKAFYQGGLVYETAFQYGN